MMRPSRAIGAFRDVVIILGMLLLCLLSLQDYSARLQERRDQDMRFEIVSSALAQLDTAYRQQIEAAKGDLNQIVLRQNQMLLEYEKLLLATQFLPARAVQRAPIPGVQPPQGSPGAPPAPTGSTPAPQQPPASPPQQPNQTPRQTP